MSTLGVGMWPESSQSRCRSMKETSLLRSQSQDVIDFPQYSITSIQSQDLKCPKFQSPKDKSFGEPKPDPGGRRAHAGWTLEGAQSNLWVGNGGLGPTDPTGERHLRPNSFHIQSGGFFTFTAQDWILNDLPATQDAWFVMTSAVPGVAMKNIYRASLVAVAQAVSEVSYPSAASAAPPWGGLGESTQMIRVMNWTHPCKCIDWSEQLATS